MLLIDDCFPHPQKALRMNRSPRDLRARIWMRYGVELHELIRQQRSPPNVGGIDDIADLFSVDALRRPAPAAVRC